MSNNSKASVQAADTKLVAGVNQYFAPAGTTITVAGVVMTPAQIVATLQSRITSIDATTTAKAAYVKATADEAALMAGTRSVANAVKAIAFIMYENEPAVLTAFGLAPKKVPVPLTVAEKAERAAKAKATRLARNTMGPKAKAKVKGTVTTAAPAATATAPATTTESLPTTVAPALSAAGTTGGGHA